MPRGNPGSWVTADDYPSSAMRGGIEGQVGVVISVGTDGRAIDVEVTQRSASPALDNATITTVMRRARFLPALRNCQPVVGEYTTVIRWAIPRD
jgi:protein TonB